MAELNDVRLIAFYLPQYHPIPENDRWWGKGFTEWTNVTKAKPNFANHYQPHFPTDLGFYDLRVPEVRAQQAELAKSYGISGFCYYYYWFGGQRLLHRPLDDMLASGQPDFPFCVCWANENWTRRWDGLEDDILMAQNYSSDDDRAFIQSLIPAFQDSRYIRVNGKPLLLIYRINLLPNPQKTVEIWRSECRAADIGEIYVATVQSFDRADPRQFGADVAVEFPPSGFDLDPITESVELTNSEFQGYLWDYPQLVERALTRPRPDYPLWRGVIPSWDNTARRQDHAHIFLNSSPDRYRQWLTQIIRKTQHSHLGDENLIFINAWNEWAEGCHLEPDQQYGHRFLAATQQARSATQIRYTELPMGDRPVAVDPDQPLVSVCIPTYNGDEFLSEALASIQAQTYGAIEVIISDDNSTDDTLSLAKQFQQTYPGPVRIFTHPQYGLVENWNFCIAQARGTYIKFLFQDDLIDSQCIAEMVALAEQDPAIALVFSPRHMILDRTGVDDHVCQNIYNSCQDLHKHWTHLQPIQSGQDLLQDPVLKDLLTHNLIGEPSTVLIRRQCFAEVGLFDTDLCQVVDTDMWYRLLGHYKIGFVDQPLSTFRVHAAQESRKNSMSGQSNQDVIHLWRKMAGTDSFNFLPQHLKETAYQNLMNVGVTPSHPPNPGEALLQLQQAEAEIIRLQERIAAMESSKFWNLRKRWFQFKRALGRGHNE